MCKTFIHKVHRSPFWTQPLAKRKEFRSPDLVQMTGRAGESASVLPRIADRVYRHKNVNTNATRPVLADERASCMTQFLAQIEIQEPNRLASREEATARVARFTALVERRSRFVFRMAYAMLRNPHDAEDVVQETFLKIYRTGAWEHMKDEKAFLARAAWRIAVEKLPDKRSEALDAEVPSTDASPEQASITANWNAVVHKLVDALPEELRQPLALSTVEELNSREIAALMGIAEGTVRTRLMRARETLKQKFAAWTEGRYEK
jgi:RNA polymerase sigma-70 factor, ECF subfamily